MIIEINGRKYRLRQNIVIRLQGIALAILAAISYKAELGTVAVFFGALAALMLTPNISRFLYWVAGKIISHKESVDRRNYK